MGDIFNWFVNYIQPLRQEGRLARGAQRGGGEACSRANRGLLALDWNNGNRTILVDQRLTGLLLGQTLYTTPAEIYRALIEATAFGALTIINRFEEYGVKVEQVVNCGGIAEKNPLVMQIYADVTGRPMKISPLGADLRAGRGHRRGGGGRQRGRLRQLRRRAEGDDRPEAEGLPARTRRRMRSIKSFIRSTASCTMPSARSRRAAICMT